MMSPNLQNFVHDASWQRNASKKLSVSKCVAIFAIVTGAISIWFVLFNPEYLLFYLGNLTLFAFAIFCWPAMMAIWFGSKLLWKVSKSSITASIGYSIFCIACFISPFAPTDYYGNDSILVPFPRLTLALAISMAAVLPYVWMSKAIIRSENLGYEGLQDLFGKPFIFLISFLFCSMMAYALRFNFPVDIDHPHLSTPINVIAILGPIFFAWIPYLIILSLMKMTDTRSNRPGPVNA